MSGLTEIIPLIWTSAIWGQYPVFSYESPEGAQWERWWLEWWALFTSWVLSRLTSHWAAVIWWLQHLLLTDMAVSVFFIHKTCDISDVDYLISLLLRKKKTDRTSSRQPVMDLKYEQEINIYFHSALKTLRITCNCNRAWSSWLIQLQTGISHVFSKTIWDYKWPFSYLMLNLTEIAIN